MKLPLKKRKYLEIFFLNGLEEATTKVDKEIGDSFAVHNDNDIELKPQIIYTEGNSLDNEESDNSLDGVISILYDVKLFDKFLDDPVSELEVSFISEEGNKNDNVDDDILGDNLSELISNAGDADADGDLDTCGDLFDKNYKLSDSEIEGEIDIEKKIDNAKNFRNKGSFFMNPVLSESVLVTPEDERNSNFVHLLDKTTFNNNLETVAEINLFQLAGGGSSSCPFKKVKRGGLRHFFSNEMRKFCHLHEKPVGKRLSKQRKEFLDNPVTLGDLTPRKAPRPNLHYYKDFINVRPNKFDDKIVQELLKVSLQPRIHHRRSSNQLTRKIKSVTDVPDVFGNLDDTFDINDDNNNKNVGESSKLISSSLTPSSSSSKSSLLSQSLSSSIHPPSPPALFSDFSFDSISSAVQFNDTNLDNNNSEVAEEFNSSQSMPSFL